MQVILRNNNRILVGNLMVADSIFSRMKGLLGTKSLPSNSGLLLQPCNSVHTFGMKYAIDVVFLDKENRVVKIYNVLKPNRLTPICFQAATVLELPANTVIKFALSTGDAVEIID